MTEAVPLVEGRLYLLPNPFTLDGRVASHPRWVRGWAPINAYLLVEDDRALLIDSGYSVHEESILAQLNSLIDFDTRLEFYPTAFGEFGSFCNVHPITDRFNVVKYHGQREQISLSLDFRPEYAPYGGPVGGGSMATVENSVPGSSLEWAGGTRELELFLPPLFLLPYKWAYDADTATLFSGDLFTHVWRGTAEGPWTVQADDAMPSVEDVYNFLIGSRYWWLSGAHTDKFEAELVQLFQERDVRVIAPRWGCAITGCEQIEAHLDLLIAALRRAREDVCTPVWLRHQLEGAR